MPARHYRFYFMRSGRTVAAEIAECNGDGGAIEKAKELLSTSAFDTMEVWQDTRKVGTVERRI